VDDASPIGIGSYQIRLAGDEQTTPDLYPGPSTRLDPLSPAIPARDDLPLITLEPLNAPSVPTWRIDRVLTLVGRAPECRMRLTDVGLSRFHCSLLRTPLGVWVVDLLGREGVRVNREGVAVARLAEGDELRVGRVRFRVSHARPSGGEGHPGASPATASKPSVPAVARFRPSEAQVFPTTVQVRTPRIASRRARVEAAADHAAPARLPRVHEPDRAFVERPSDPLVDLVVEQFDRMNQQMASMQQQMSDQFHQTMMAVFQMFGTMHRDQMALVHEELEQIRRLSDELKALKSGEVLNPSPQNGPAPAGPAPPTLPKHRPPGDRAPTPASPAPGAGPNGPAVAGDSPRQDPPPATGRGPAAAARTAARRDAAGRPAASDVASMHEMLSQRIAELHRERQTRWNRILELVVGR
jgi:pSer/pThr/pTyr-binding forkhead associated (FHA) protein